MLFTAVDLLNMYFSGPEITTTLSESSNTDTDSVVVDYTVETGSGVFDRYYFSMNDKQSTTVTKDHDDARRTVQFDRLEAGFLYTVTAWTKSGSEKSGEISTKVRTGGIIHQ